MGFLSRLFLESPYLLGCAAFGLLAVGLFVRLRLEGAARRRIVPGVLAVCVLLFLVQGLVVTQRERIQQALNEFVVAIEQETERDAALLVSDDYESEEMDREQFLEMLASFRERLRIYDSRFIRESTEVRGDTAETDLTAKATISVDGGVGEMHWGRWRMGWIRQGDEWRIRSIEPLSVDGIPMTSLRDLRRTVP